MPFSLKDRLLSSKSTFAWRTRVFAALGCFFACYAGASAIASFGDELLEVPLVAGPRKTVDLPLPALHDHANALHAATGERFDMQESMRAGDSLGTLFDRLGIADRSAQDFIRTDKLARRLLQLQPGRLISARADEDGSLVSLKFPDTAAPADKQDAPLREASNSRVISIDRTGDGQYRAAEQTVENERRIEMRTGSIASSLFAAADAADVPDTVTQQIIDIFDGELDFHADLRRDDSFRVIYESFWLNGQYVRPGRVLAIEFVNGGVAHDAVWFEAEAGKGAYYDFQGRSVKRAFLRSPLEFSRISSGFSGARFHPVNQRWQAHRGVDYAAGAGTPVRSIGEGVVEFAGWQNGYGNVVILKHGDTYETLYAHMRGFAPMVAKGMHIEQGQTIGYVGMTGWATGPHLHFEFHVDGQPHDPTRIAMPEAMPIEGAVKPLFTSSMTDYRRRLSLLAAATLVAVAP